MTTQVEQTSTTSKEDTKTKLIESSTFKLFDFMDYVDCY